MDTAQGPYVVNVKLLYVLRAVLVLLCAVSGEEYGIFSSAKTKISVSLGDSLGGFGTSAPRRSRADTDDLFSSPPTHTTPVTTHTHSQPQVQLHMCV